MGEGLLKEKLIVYRLLAANGVNEVRCRHLL